MGQKPDLNFVSVPRGAVTAMQPTVILKSPGRAPWMIGELSLPLAPRGTPQYSQARVTGSNTRDRGDWTSGGQHSIEGTEVK